MKHVNVFAIKFISNFILFSIILGLFFDMAFRNIFLITLVLCVVAYLIGDLLILPRTNNAIATIVDFGLAFVVIWLMSENLTYGDVELIMPLTAAIGVALFEYMFHRYLSNNILPDRPTRQRSANIQKYQTEASKELTPVYPDIATETNINKKEYEIISDEDVIKRGLLEDTGNGLSEADPKEQPEQTPEYHGGDANINKKEYEIISDEDVIKRGLLEDTGNGLSEADPKEQPEQTPEYHGGDANTNKEKYEIISDEDVIKRELLENTGNGLSEADPEEQPEQTPKYQGGNE
ncbi:DUF2512 family protein [Bacillus sp. 'calajunan']|uniref:YndM family protein n=1 Tax=Bacillus sp. 'calajunan' TaxID=3447457 RepID=UPI003EDEAA90